MEERDLRNNYVFTLVKFILFLIIFCFFIELVKEFWKEAKANGNFSITAFVLSMLSAFGFYVFLTDLNNSYKKIQNFFFRSSFFTLLFPSTLIILGIGYFLFPRLLNFSFNKAIFIFVGGFVLTTHLIFIAREIKGHTLNTFVNYLFFLSILSTLNLFLFELYLKIGFKIRIGKIALEGVKNGSTLIQSIFTQAFR